MPEPLTDRQLAEIDERDTDARLDGSWDDPVERDRAALLAEVKRLCSALRNIVNVLGPDSICSCTDNDCGLRDEASDALTVAKEALPESNRAEVEK